MDSLISWPLKFIALFLEWLQIRIDKYMVYAWNMSLTVGPGFSSPINIACLSHRYICDFYIFKKAMDTTGDYTFHLSHHNADFKS